MQARRVLIWTGVLMTALALAAPPMEAAEAPDYDGEFFTSLRAEGIHGRTKVEISKTLRLAAQASRIHPMLVVIDRLSDFPRMPQTIDGFATALAKDWKVGDAETKKGILVLFSISDRKLFVSKTANLDQDVSDAVSKAMGGKVTDALREGDVTRAMKLAAGAIAETLPDQGSSLGAAGGGKQRTVTRTTRTRTPRGGYSRRGGSGIGCFGIMIIFMVLSSIIGSFTGRGGWGGGMRGGYYGGGGGFFSGMLAGGMLGHMFGGGHGGWGGGYGGGGGFTETTTTESWTDGGGGGGGGGFFDSFGGGDFDGGGSFGEW